MLVSTVCCSSRLFLLLVVLTPFAMQPEAPARDQCSSESTRTSTHSSAVVRVFEVVPVWSSLDTAYTVREYTSGDATSQS
jgi:hypothetical protein